MGKIDVVVNGLAVPEVPIIGAHALEGGSRSADKELVVLKPPFPLTGPSVIIILVK